MPLSFAAGGIATSASPGPGASSRATGRIIKICYCLTDFSQRDSRRMSWPLKTHLRTEPLMLRKGQGDPIGVKSAT